MCKIFDVSKSSFYDKTRFISSPRDRENRMLLYEIRRIHEQSKASYGSPRITEELNSQGHKISRPRVARLMKESGIRAVHAKKFVVTTDSKHNYPVVENLLDRNFEAKEPGQKWVSDITYIRTKTGWLYLTTVIDLYDRKVIGWSFSKDMTAANTSIAAWKMAVGNRLPSNELIFHSDRGIQYACNEFTRLLETYQNVKRSMSRKGNCWDNAVAESFFKTLKVEFTYGEKFNNQEQAELAIFEWIETWYNRARRHSALMNMTIAEFNNKKYQNVA